MKAASVNTQLATVVMILIITEDSSLEQQLIIVNNHALDTAFDNK
jgi:hypothetical protein